jgi:hypothetical protein
MNGTSYAYGGAGAAGTSFSGGSGGGGAMNRLGGDGTAAYGGAGAANGGAGGNGAMASDISIGGGGAGNPPGANVKGSADLVYTSVPAGNTGGLLILTVMGYLYIASGAVVSSNGGNGGYWYAYSENGYFADVLVGKWWR